MVGCFALIRHACLRWVVCKPAGVENGNPKARHRRSRCSRYFSPESTSRVATVAPGPSCRPSRIAASTLAPDEVPANSPSSLRQAPRHGLGLVGRDRDDLVDQVRRPHRRRGSRCRCLRSDARPVRRRRARRIPPARPRRCGSRIVALQHGGDALQRGHGADRLHEGIDLAAGLGPDLLAHRMIAGDAVAVVELVGPTGVGLGRDRLRGGDHGLDELLGDLAARRSGSACSSAPKARIWVSFSALKASEVTIFRR